MKIAARTESRLAHAGSINNEVNIPVGLSPDGKTLYSGLVYLPRPFLMFDGGRVNTGTSDFYLTRCAE